MRSRELVVWPDRCMTGRMLETLRQRLTLGTNDARSIVERTFRNHPDHRFAVRLWTGEEVAWGGPRDFTLSFGDAETFRRCFLSADPAEFAEAYVAERLFIEGDLWAAAGLSSYLRKVRIDLREKLRFAPKLVVPASEHTVDDDSRDVRAHYDLSDELFELFLDEKMVYSCAYFATPEQSLERAQERKLDMICRKLALRPGERFLDIGCGWGALPIWAARHFGVQAVGITLSHNQATEARRRAAAAGVADRVTVELRHYADVPAKEFDKVSSVGMYEHVGLSKLESYLGAVHRALRPGGLFLNHGITEPANSSANGGSFIFRHVFPGAELCDVSRLLGAMEAARFEILDVQSLRPHYALTLREWFRRFTERRSAAAKLAPERLLRAWDLYLAGCARAFEDGVISVHQVLVAKPDEQGRNLAPLTREGSGPAVAGER